jgi:hypothetical protein
MTRSPLALLTKAPVKKGGTILLKLSLFKGGTILPKVSLFKGGTILIKLSLLTGETILLKVPLFKGDLGRSSTFGCGKNDCSDIFSSPVAVKLPTLSFSPSPRLLVSPSGKLEIGSD